MMGDERGGAQTEQTRADIPGRGSQDHARPLGSAGRDGQTGGVRVQPYAVQLPTREEER